MAPHIVLVALGLVFSSLDAAAPDAQRPAPPATGAPEITVEQLGRCAASDTTELTAAERRGPRAVGLPVQLPPRSGVITLSLEQNVARTPSGNRPFRTRPRTPSATS